MNDTNIFSTLGRYVRRQNENLLTQSLAAIFSHCPVFRSDLLELIEQRSGGKPLNLTDACCETQSAQYLKKGRILVDLKICCNGDSSPKCVIEAKLDAPLSAKQAKRYSEFLKRRRGRSRLVLLTVHGVDTQLKKLLKNAIWLTWTELAELAMRPASDRTKTERFLCKQFYKMLEGGGIPMARSVTSGEYKKLTSLNKFVVGRYRRLTSSHVDSLNSIMTRMQRFAEASWRSLADNDYRAYDGLYRYPSENGKVDSHCTEIEVGFYRVKNRKPVSSRCIFLSIECEKPRLTVWAGWKSGGEHQGQSLKTWSPKESCELFKTPLPEAQAIIRAELDKCLWRFKQSRYFKS